MHHHPSLLGDLDTLKLVSGGQIMSTFEDIGADISGNTERAQEHVYS